MRYKSIFYVIIFSMHISGYGSEVDPLKFSEDLTKKGPYTTRDLDNCFDYFSGNDQVGHEEYYHDTGKIKLQLQLKNGKKRDLQRFWYPNGQIRSIIHYSNGVIDGEWKEWAESGYLECDSLFINGSGKRVVKYMSGSIKLIEEYKNGELNGYSRKYFENGKISSVSKFRDSVQIDSVFSFDATGKLTSFGTFGEHGLMNGLSVVYSSKIPELYWFKAGAMLWSSLSGNSIPAELQGKDLDPMKFWNAIVVPPEYLKSE